MRKLPLPALALFLVIGLLGVAGTLAEFQDTEASSGNSFTDGTLDLKVSDWNEGFGDGVSVTWTMSKMVPGITSVGPFSVFLQNSGSLAANHVEISFNHSIDEGAPQESDTNPASTPGELARWIQITSMSYDGVNFLSTLTDANGNGFLDLEDVTLPPNNTEGGPLDNLAPPPPHGGGTRAFTMALRFHENATNDIQGDMLTATVTFTLNQESSQ